MTIKTFIIIKCPKWGRFLARDRDGSWFVYQHKPVIDEARGVWDGIGLQRRIARQYEIRCKNGWKKSLRDAFDTLESQHSNSKGGDYVLHSRR